MDTLPTNQARSLRRTRIAAGVQFVIACAASVAILAFHKQLGEVRWGSVGWSQVPVSNLFFLSNGLLFGAYCFGAVWTSRAFSRRWALALVPFCYGLVWGVGFIQFVFWCMNADVRGVPDPFGVWTSGLRGTAYYKVISWGSCLLAAVCVFIVTLSWRAFLAALAGMAIYVWFIHVREPAMFHPSFTALDLWPLTVWHAIMAGILYVWACVHARRVLLTQSGACSTCGYKLEGLPNGQCPECGKWNEIPSAASGRRPEMPGVPPLEMG